MKTPTVLAFFLGLASALVTPAPGGLESQPDLAITSTHAAPLEGASEGHAMLAKRALATQRSAPWGLRAISHRRAGAIYEESPPIPESKYYYDDGAGLDTYAYVLDTGIRTTHEEFEGRAETIFTLYPGNDNDNDGHGTAVAGVIGGKTYGVAKRAKLLAVKVLDDTGSCTASAALHALSWTAKHILINGRKHSSVINLSFRLIKVHALSSAIEALISAGITVVSAAGNQNEDASLSTSGSTEGIINVGYVDKNWIMSPDSNWGPSVTMLAPGVDVECPSSANDADAVLKSGSSLAAPHVAGLALNAMSVHGIKGPAEVKEFLLQTATRKQACTHNDTPNIVGNNGNTVQTKHWWPRMC